MARMMQTANGVKEYTDFQFALQTRIWDAIRKMRKCGAVGASIECLKQNTNLRGLDMLAGAPQGTNCQYYFNEIFTELVSDSREISRFVRAAD